MKTLKNALIALLAVQLILALGLWWQQQQQQNSRSQQHTLLTFTPEKIDKITVGDQKKQVTLTKVNGKWQLPALQALPGDSVKISALLNQLHGLRVNWPVATTANAEQRFKVSNKQFNKKVELYAGDKVVSTLYVGTSPGFRKSNVRNAGEVKTYSVELGDYQLPTNNEQWLEKGLLSVPMDVTTINGPDYTLTKQGENWQFADAQGQTRPTNEKAVKQLLNALQQLRIGGVAAKAPATKTDTTSLTITAKNHRWHYQWLHDGKQYLVKRDDYPQWFTVNMYGYDQVAKITAQQLLAPAKAKGKDAAVDSTPTTQAPPAMAAASPTPPAKAKTDTTR